MRAADLLRASVMMGRAQGAGLAEGTTPTLADKRRALADPDVARALRLIRDGFAKPITSPRAGQTLDASTLFPDFAALRLLARALGIEMHVRFADGRPTEALVIATDGLRLATLPLGEALIGSLVGIACEAIVLARVAMHIDSLPARECDRLGRLALDLLAQPHSIQAMMSGERVFFASSMNTLWKGLTSSESFLDMLGYGPGDDNPPTPEALETAARLNALRSDPAGQKRITESLFARYDSQVALMIAAVDDPRRIPLPEPGRSGDAAVDGLANMLLPTFTNLPERVVQVQIQRQLLGVHAAIRRYRWETDRLPERLADLRIGRELLIDPYTRQSLVYEMAKGDLRAIGGFAYKLASVGPPAHDDDGNILPGQRSQITLPWRRS